FTPPTDRVDVQRVRRGRQIPPKEAKHGGRHALTQPFVCPATGAIVSVTGASRGIGFAAARAVIELGGCVVAVARSADDALLDKLAGSSQEAAKSRVAVVRGDITDPSVCDSVVDASLKRFGKVDASNVLVRRSGHLSRWTEFNPLTTGNGKGRQRAQNAFGQSPAVFSVESNHILVVRICRLFDVNLFAVFLLTQKALPHLRKQRGRVVMVSSGAANKAYVGWSAYCCSKAALNMLTENLAAEEPEIASVAVRPGVVETEMQKIIRDSGA
ncbi:MAG: hypothetical protein BJ554DRAFT_28, partial [Olpidium bornovanus]